MITALKIENFRKFKHLELSFDRELVILVGPNAQGKTTVLEAISVLTNGASSWGTRFQQLVRQHDLVSTRSGPEEIFYENPVELDDPYFRITIRENSENIERERTLFHQSGRKTYLLNGKKTTSKKFLSQSASTLFSPEQIELLMYSPAIRRHFLDQVISQFDPEYQLDLTSFKRALRQRNSYLKKLSKRFYETGEIALEDPQLRIWTDTFATLSEKLHSSRKQFIGRLSVEDFELLYIPSGEYAESDYHKSIDDSLKRDIVTGITNVGAHRDDWEIIRDKNIKMYGSRGEKRFAIGKLILLCQEIIAESIGFYPTLLLDDIPSELDQNNVALFLTDEQIGKQQTFISTITTEQFPPQILEKAQIIQFQKIKTS